jgi:3-isopropylmalate dehydrogenase
MELNLAILGGDGVGAAGTTQALNVLQTVGEKFGHSFNLNEGLVGGVAIDSRGRARSHESLCIIVEYAKAELERRIIWNSI